MQLSVLLLLACARGCAARLFLDTEGFSVMKPSGIDNGAMLDTRQQCALTKSIRANMALNASERCRSYCFVVVAPEQTTEDKCSLWSSQAYWFEDTCLIDCSKLFEYTETLKTGTCIARSKPIELYPGPPPAVITPKSLYALPMPCMETICTFSYVLTAENNFACEYNTIRNWFMLGFGGVAVFAVVFTLWTKNCIRHPRLLLIIPFPLLAFVWDFVVIAVVVLESLWYCKEACTRRPPQYSNIDRRQPQQATTNPAAVRVFRV
jgi:hypothetical protein